MKQSERAHEVASSDAEGSRRRFLKKAGTIVVAAPVMESLSREGILVRSAHAQSAVQGIEGVFGGSIFDPL